MKLGEALKPLLQDHSKYKLAKILEVQPIMIDNYLHGRIKDPSWRVCKNFYNYTGVCVQEYTEHELTAEHEQSRMEINRRSNESTDSNEDPQSL